MDSDSRFLGFRSNFQNTTRWVLWIFGSCNVRALIVYVLSFILHYIMFDFMYKWMIWVFGRSSCRFWSEKMTRGLFCDVIARIRLPERFGIETLWKTNQTVPFLAWKWLTGFCTGGRILGKIRRVLHDPDFDPFDPCKIPGFDLILSGMVFWHMFLEFWI